MIVNVEALDLGLGSGGFDIVHVNLTRGLESAGAPGAQRDEAQLHEPAARGRRRSRTSSLELPARAARGGARAARPARGGGLGLRQARPGARLGYVQTEGGALPGRALAHGARRCASAGCSPGHLTAGAAFGGEGEAITTAGALHHGLRDARLGRGRVRARARGSSARARRSGTAAWRRSTPPTWRSRSAARRCSSRACPRATARAPPRHLPPHADRARPAARAGHGGAAGGHALAGRRRPARGPGGGLRRREPRAVPRSRSTSSARCGSPATTGAARRSTCPPTRPAGCRARRWGARLAEDPLFFGAALAGWHGARRACSGRASRADSGGEATA